LACRFLSIIENTAADVDVVPPAVVVVAAASAAAD